MDKVNYLMYACIAIWSGFGLYLLSLGLRQKKLERRLRLLERITPQQTDE